MNKNSTSERNQHEEIAPPILLDKEAEFLITEYTSLRNEMDMLQKHGYTLEISLLAGVVGIAGFFFGKTTSSVFIGIGTGTIIILAALKKLQLIYAMDNLQKHLLEIENLFTTRGWEATQKKRNSKKECWLKEWGLIIGKSGTATYWILMALSAIVLFFAR